MSERLHRAKHHDLNDDGPSHKYFTQIPNTIVRGKKGWGLSLPARWLYVYLKSITGDKGECTRSTTTLAKEAQLGRGTIASAKLELIHAGLIMLITKRDGYHDTDKIRIVDIWPENMEEFASRCSPDEQPIGSCSLPELSCSPDEQQVTPEKSTNPNSGCSLPELSCSPGEQKKIPIRRRSSEKDKNPPISPQPTAARRKDTLTTQAKEVLDYFNQVHERNLGRADQIKTLLETGVSVEDCRLVIDWLYQVERLTNQDGYHKYVDNVTPFRPMNFDRHLDKATRWKNGVRTQRPSRGVVL
jgi:hypothetical protein